ncbi:recombinase XerD [Aquisediminimonas profunda]|uniref:recombinase XerD n=1 Tax=Aquisediminimonas profunda TaxID=1550733 RepID=UPI001C62DD55|nr:recombinase XerD [Aquisediminimonas profunda]
MLIGRREHKASLGREGAPGFLALYEAEARKFDIEVNKAVKQSSGSFDPLDPPLVRYLADSFSHKALAVDEAQRDRLPSPYPRFMPRGNPEEDYLASRELLEGYGNRDELKEYWGEWVYEYATDMGYILDPNGEDLKDLCEAIAGAAARMWVDHYQVRMDPEHSQGGARTKTPIKPCKPLEGTSSPIGPRVPLLATFDAYAASRGMTPNVREEWRASIVRLVKFLGHDDAAAVSSSDLRRWRDVLREEVLPKGTKRSPVTVRNKYIRPVKATYAWALGEELLTHNPGTAVKVDTPKAARLRSKAFTDLEARAILKATLDPPPARLSVSYARARRWMPWLMAYSGARVNELSQLRGKDITEIEGHWTMRLTPDAGTIKNKEARIVPLHQHLIDQGFLAVVQETGAGPLFYDPTLVKVQKDTNRHVKKVGERIAEWVRNEVGIADKDVMPSHGWRYRFKGLSHDWAMEERMVDAIQGHAPQTVGRTYDGASITAMAKAIAKIPHYQVDGV